MSIRLLSDYSQNKNVNIQISNTNSILTPSRGWINSFNFTLNPYIGCTFGCKACYVPEIGVYGPHRPENGKWGNYVFIKIRAPEIIRKKSSTLDGKTIFMSSVCDPYQPVESNSLLTRSILKSFINSGVNLTIQTSVKLT